MHSANHSRLLWSRRQVGVCFRVMLCALFLLPISKYCAASEETAPPDELGPSAAAANRVAPPTIPLSQALETRGDLSLQNASMEKALIVIGASWNVNVTVGKNVQGKVSCAYKQMKLRDVLDAILLANGYSYRAVGESLVVLNAEEVGSANPLFQSATISITHSNLQEIADGASLLKSKQGHIQVLESARSLLVVDFADRVATIRDFAKRMDAAASHATGGIPLHSNQQLQVAEFRTQYIPVKNVEEPLNAVISSTGTLGLMEKENRLVVADYAPNVEMVRRVLEKIDRPQSQVRITALIYDISVQDIEQLGFNWSNVGKGNNLDADGNLQQLVGLGSQTVPFEGSANTAQALTAGVTPLVTGPNTGVFALQSITRNFDISVVGQFLQNAKDARLLANPNVTVMNNETADMSVVQEIPFQQLTQTQQGGNLATTSFKEVGIKLNVTPTVSADGTIKMLVEQEFGRVVERPENAPPTVDTSAANTMVRVANRQTLVIGGLRQRSDTGEFNGIPVLKDLWGIGPLFRSRDTLVRESELVIFLMPEIVDYGQNHSPREYMANETVNCRLDRIPIAEGCPSDCHGGAACDRSSHMLVPLPLVDGESGTLHEAGHPRSTSTPSIVDTTPFRPGFDERFRAPGGTDARRQTLRDSPEPTTTESPETKRSALLRLFSPKR